MIKGIMRFFLGSTLILLPLIGFGTVYLITGHDTGAGFQPAYLTMALAVVLGLVDLLFRHQCKRDIRAAMGLVVSRSSIVIVLSTLTVVLISALGLGIAPVVESSSMVWGRFLRQFIQLSIMGCFTVFTAVFLNLSYPDSRIRWQMFSRFLVWGALIQVVYGIFQEIHFFQPFEIFAGLERIFTSNPSILSGSESLYLSNTFQNVPRLRGTACEPLYLGNYLLLVWPFVFLTGWSKLWRVVSLFFLLVLLLLTWSRGAWLGFIFQGCLISFLYLRSSNFFSAPSTIHLSRRSIMIGACFVLMGIGLVLVAHWKGDFFPYERMRQAFSTQDWSNLTRLFSMQAAWRAFLLSPVVGVGWGQFAWHFPLLVDPMGLQSQFSWPVVNNYPLQVLCETGVLGLAVFILSAFYLVTRALGSCRKLNSRSVVAVALVAACGVWIQLLTFSQYNLPHIWVALGPLVAVASHPPKDYDHQESGL